MPKDLSNSPNNAQEATKNSPKKSSVVLGWVSGIRTALGQFLNNKNTQPLNVNADEIAPPSLESLTGAAVMNRAIENGVGFEQEVNPGFLIEQGETTKNVYIFVNGKGKITIRGEDGTIHTIANLNPGDLLCEISALGLNGGKTTASIEVEESSNFYVIPVEDFLKIIENPELKVQVEGMACRRFLETADRQLKIEEFIEQKKLEQVGETPNQELATALSLSEAIKDGLDSKKEIERTVTMATMTVDKKVFLNPLIIRYKRVSDDGYEVWIGDKTNTETEYISIHKNFSRDGKVVREPNPIIKKSQESGIYSRILRYILRGVDEIYSGLIIEAITTDFIEKRKDGRENIPHSELSANSPLVAARKGFISVMKGYALSSYRVDPQLAVALTILTDVERNIAHMEIASDAVLQERYGMGKEEILKEMRVAMIEYKQNDAYEKLSEDIKPLCDLQIKRVEELWEQYCKD